AAGRMTQGERQLAQARARGLKGLASGCARAARLARRKPLGRNVGLGAGGALTFPARVVQKSRAGNAKRSQPRNESRTTGGGLGRADPSPWERESQGVVPARVSSQCRGVGKRLRVLPPGAALRCWRGEGVAGGPAEGRAGRGGTTR